MDTQTRKKEKNCHNDGREDLGDPGSIKAAGLDELLQAEAATTAKTSTTLG